MTIKSKALLLLIPLSGLSIASCGGVEETSESDSQSTSSSQSVEETTSSYEEPPHPDYEHFTIYFDSQGGSHVYNQYVRPGEMASEPDAPTKPGYDFGGWYTEAECLIEFDFSTQINSDWHLFAKWVGEAEQGDPEPLTLYFRDSSWWSTDGAVTYAKLGNDMLSDYGEMMENLRFCNQEYQGVGYNYWKVEIPDAKAAETIVFTRMGLVDGAAVNWNAFTVEVDLSTRGESNMYDILSTDPTWGSPVTGTWATYDENDLGNVDAPEQPTSGYYLTGTMTEWANVAEYAMIPNSGNANEVMLTGVALEEGTEFKIVDANVEPAAYYGYSAIKAECPLRGTAFEEGTDGSIKVLLSGSYSFYFDFTTAPGLWIG